jgi:hypothetical protein
MVAVKHHPRDKYPITEVITTQASLKVSRSHRSEVGGNDDAHSGDLCEGDSVFVGSRKRAIRRVNHIEDEATELFEVTVRPDGSFDILVIPKWGLHTCSSESLPLDQDFAPPMSRHDTHGLRMDAMPQVLDEDKFLRAMPTGIDY